MIRTKNKIIHRALSLMLSVILLLSAIPLITSCGRRNTITVWVYSSECMEQAEEFLKSTKLKLGFKANFRAVNASDFREELDKAIESGEGIPDVFMLSPDNISDYVNSDITADISKLGLNYDDEKFYGYTTAAGRTQQGVLKAVGWQADPGIFMYRRSMAKVYLGTDKPDEIQQMISNWEGFYAAAQKVYSKSGGKTRMLAGQEDMLRPYLYSSGNRWVDNGSLVISDGAKAYFDYVGKMTEEHLIYTAEQWSEAWVAGISDSRSVFGYFSSGICMQNVMKKACGGAIKSEGTYGDWAAVAGPAGYFWGGSWLAAYSGTKYQKEAAEFIRLLTGCTEDTNEFEQSIKYFRTTGYFSANREVVKSIRFDPQFEDSFIGGQNYYQQLSNVAERVDIEVFTVYDTKLFEIFDSCVNDFAGGFKSKAQALSDFKTSVGVAFPELNVQ